MKKKQILEEAFKLYAKHGYESASMQQIADAVSIEKASLYGHFKSKNEIFMTVLLNEFQSIESALLEGIKEDELLYDLIEKIFINTIEYFRNKEKLLFWKQIVLLSAIDSDDEFYKQARSVVQSFDKKVMSVLSVSAQASNIDEDTQRIISLYFLIFTQGFLDWFLMQKKVDDNIMNMSVKMFNHIIKASHPFI